VLLEVIIGAFLSANRRPPRIRSGAGFFGIVLQQITAESHRLPILKFSGAGVKIDRRCVRGGA
jgi:hypothetical protein